MLAIEKIEAHETLLAIRVSSYPHQKEVAQTKLFNELTNRAMLEQKELDASEIAKALGFI